MRGSISLARLICVEIYGEPVPGDTDGNYYGSVEIAEILSAGYEKLKTENSALQARIAAAPDLLEALELLIDDLRLRAKLRGDDCLDVSNGRLYKAQKAIAKAKGEE